MARLDASLTQGLMNPTYQKELGQVGGMLGGMGAHMRQTRRDKEEAQKMAGMSYEAKLDHMTANAVTPADSLKYGEMLNKTRTASEDREFLIEERKEQARKRKQTQAEKLAGSKLSAMGVRHKALVKSGKTEEADKLLGEMEEIAGRAMVKLSDYVEDVDSSGRYMNIGDGIVFDTYTGEAIDNKTGEKVDLNTLDPKDLASAIKSNQEAYTPVSWDNYSAKLAETGDPALAAKELVAVDTAKSDEQASASAVADANRNMRIIDDLLEKDINGWTQATLWWVPEGEAKSVDNAVDTLKANVAFDRLQKMRDNSKTGGALGQVSEKELKLLEANLASLDPTSAEFKDNLRTIRSTYERVVDIEQGPEGGSPNYVRDESGVVYWVDPTNDQVYNYATGQLVSQ